MNMVHPLHFLPPGLLKPVFWFSTGLTVACFALFGVLDLPLRTPAAASGVVSFELAQTPQAARAIVTSWDSRAQLFAAFGLGFDFLFMPVYATALSAGVLLAAPRLRGVRSAWAAAFGWMPFGAALCDAGENISLFLILINAQSGLAPLAAGLAWLKFGLILLALAFGLVGLMAGRRHEV